MRKYLLGGILGAIGILLILNRFGGIIFEEWHYTMIETVGRSDALIKCRYNVNNKGYMIEVPLPAVWPKIVGGRYYLKYKAADPTIYVILWDKPVPISIADPPIEGWKKIPQE